MKADDVKKLQQKKYRNEWRHFLVEGEHLILELHKAAFHSKKTQQHLQQAELFITEDYSDWVKDKLGDVFRTTVVGKKAMSQMSDTKSPQGIVAAVPFPPPAGQHEDAGLRTLYLHEIQDPGNLGTILRTLGWFGGYRCLLSPGSVDPYNPKVVRSSMGAIFHVLFGQDVSIEELARRCQSIACLDMNGTPLSRIRAGHHDAFIFGNEARGIPHEQLSALNVTTYTIPGSGTIESLNLASAVNMCVYELSQPD
ncbi:MAG: rRNA methyltransferase [Oceanospirillaceae bacterium]|nr:rRNA methyltransferase [Oceanospirillaceae bacterium]|tara:strand:- start:1575 stop:2333 length:759 start_codon:yes stop_codon:yes gene_type:complete